MAESTVRSRSLAELFAGLEEAEDLDAAFVQRVLDGAAARDPALPELLRAAAIPRILDRDVVGVLRGTPEDAAGNAHMLELVAEYHFVLQRADGGFVYHDTTRDALLADWRSTAEKRARFAELNDALAAHHERRHDDSLIAARYLERVRALIYVANQQRLLRLVAAVEAARTSTLMEAFYHRLMSSPEDGVGFLQTQIPTLEQSDQLAACRSLISLGRDFVQRLPAADNNRTLRGWLNYFDVRVGIRSGGYDQARAEEVFQALANDEQLPAELRVWSFDDLAAVYEKRLELDRALRIRVELTQTKAGTDVYNDPLRNLNFGHLYWLMDDYPLAIRQFEQAITKADSLPETRDDVSVLARLDLAHVQSILGDWDAAFEAATEALLWARGSLADDRYLHQQTALRFAQLLSTFDPRASDCAAAEAAGLAEGSPASRLWLVISHVAVLSHADRVRTARARLDELGDEVEEAIRERWFHLEVMYHRALLWRREGQDARAVALQSQIVQETRQRPEERSNFLNALVARGVWRITLGDLDGAAADLVEGAREWRRSGMQVQAALADVWRADCLRLAGDTDGARRLLDDAAAALPADSIESAYLNRVAGQVDERTGDWAGALRKYRQALDNYARGRSRAEHAGVLRRLAVVHGELSDWTAAAEHDRRAAKVATEMAAADRDTRTEATRAVDRTIVEAMIRFGDREDRSRSLEIARQLFRSAADHEPDNLWPYLGLTVTHARQQDWQAAVGALNRVLALCPAPMRTQSLYRRLRDYATTQAAALRRQGDLDQAVRLLGDVVDRIGDALPPAEMAAVHATRAALMLLLDDPENARQAYQSAVAGSATPTGPAEVIAAQAHSVADLWTVERALSVLADAAEPGSGMSEAVAVTRVALAARIDELLGLVPEYEPLDPPIVTPVVVEVGDDLVPIVDSNRDGGHFLYELIPALRERVRALVGVVLPGLRMRSDPRLPPTAYRIEVDEVEVSLGRVDPSVTYLARPAVGPGDPGSDRADIQPLTGQPGLWLITPVDWGEHDAADPDDGAAEAAGAVSPVPLTAPQYLLHRFERILRRHLHRFVGPQEVTDLLNTWVTVHGDPVANLVAGVVVDDLARLRFTWLVQALLAEQVPVADPEAVLTSVREAGGLAAPLDTLLAAVRRRLRDRLPGALSGGRLVWVPAEHEDALLGRAAVGPSPRLALLNWLQTELATSRAVATTLVVRDPAVRRLVAALVRDEDTLLAVRSADELPRPGSAP